MRGNPAPTGDLPAIELRRDASGHIRSVIGDLEGLLGWRPDDVIGVASTSLIHPQDHASAVAAWLGMLERPNGVSRWRGRYRQANDEWAWVESINTNRLDDAEIGLVVTTMYRIPEAGLSVEEQLRAQQELVAQLADALPIGVVHFGADRSVHFANDRLHTLVGGDEGAHLDALLSRVPASQRAGVDRAIDETLANHPVDELEFQLVRSGGTPMTCLLSLRPLTDSLGCVNGGVGTVQDVTERVRLRERLQVQARTDDLTGCANRGAILRTLRDAIQDIEFSRHGLAVVFVDLDDFKAINDTHGHVAGDTILRDTAARIKAELRSTDSIGRVGGDEFLIVSPNVSDHQTAELLAARIRSATTRTTGVLGEPCRVSASVGFAFTDSAISPEKLVARADQLMYRDKALAVDEQTGGLAA